MPNQKHRAAAKRKKQDQQDAYLIACHNKVRSEQITQSKHFDAYLTCYKEKARRRLVYWEREYSRASELTLAKWDQYTYSYSIGGTFEFQQYNWHLYEIAHTAAASAYKKYLSAKFSYDRALDLDSAISANQKNNFQQPLSLIESPSNYNSATAPFKWNDTTYCNYPTFTRFFPDNYPLFPDEHSFTEHHLEAYPSKLDIDEEMKTPKENHDEQVMSGSSAQTQNVSKNKSTLFYNEISKDETESQTISPKEESFLDACGFGISE